MLPLDGVRILAVSQYGAGPFGTLHLADLGAEIIKIEDPAVKGDISRYVVPYTVGNDSLFFQAFNRNKKSLTLNLKSAKGKEIFYGLVEVSDAVFNNLRGDQPAKLGLTYADLKEINPRIVCCSLSGYGTNGPRYKEPGYDYIIQGLAGYMDLTGEPDGPPTKAGLSVVDFSTGLCAALGLMVGLYDAKKNGRGGDIDISLLDTAVSMHTYLAAWHLNKGFLPRRMASSAHPTFVPSQNFKTRDGWMVVMCNKQKFWEALCQALGRDDLAADERFRTIEARYRNRDVLLPLLQEIFLRRGTSEWLFLLEHCQVPCGPINTFAQVFAEPQVIARQMVVDVAHPVYGNLKEMGCPIKVAGAALKYERAPALGEHTAEILKEHLDYSPEQIQALQDEGVV